MFGGGAGEARTAGGDVAGVTTGAGGAGSAVQPAVISSVTAATRRPNGLPLAQMIIKKV
ncbi:hypothetical protein Aph02nite_73930 [Actinoplanes philippinensis]|nr:hypothetical protein Aph02nite_73930 [Actinoplanes philippinensis]